MTKSSKYGRPIWSQVFEASKSISQPFTPKTIIEKVHETSPEIPDISIRTFVIAMAPNHPSSKHYPSTRKNHGYFTYLGDGKFQLGTVSITTPLPSPSPSIKNDKEVFIIENTDTILRWLKENKEKIIEARRNYTWGDYPPRIAIEKRRDISRKIINSRIRNYGGIDIETVNAVMDWGGMRPLLLEDPSEVLSVTKDAFNHLDDGDLKGAAQILLKINGFGIASVSKLIGLSDGERYCIYDSRVGTALRTLERNGKKLLLSPAGRTRPGDTCPKMEWAGHFESLIWILEVCRDQLNAEGYPFNIGDVEMALFMIGQ